MALKDIFREVAIQRSEKQPDLVDYVLEEAPILGMMPMQPTTSGLSHQYEVLMDADAASFVDLDQELPSINAETRVENTKVGLLGGEIEVGEDKINELGISAADYFARKMPHILKHTGARTEQAMLYNFLRARAIQAYNDSELTHKSEHLMSAGGNSGTNYSIIFVKWEMDNMYGLYNPSGFGNGMLFDMQAINGGSLYHTKASASKVLGYGLRIKSHFGLLAGNPRNVAVIANIDISDAVDTNWDLPTAYQMDDAVAAIRGAMGGNTMMLMHPKAKTALGKYKTEKIELTTADQNLRFTVDAWNGIPMLSSYNFKKGDEPNVTVS